MRRSDKDILEMFDFFMGDRASDNDVMLDTQEISKDARLNCNAHILLCVTATADKVFKDLQSAIGVHKLVRVYSQISGSRIQYGI